MRNYSQNNEQALIAQYFQGKRQKGHFLDIGANDGVTLSNTCALALKGWEGVYIEPSPAALSKLYANLESTFPDWQSRFEVCEVAITNTTGPITMWDSGKHLSENDRALLSTTKREEVKRWKGTAEFTEIQVEGRTWADLRLEGPFHFVSIDAEGVDLDIMQQIDFADLDTEMLIIEYNNDRQVKRAMVEEAQKHGLSLWRENFENLIFTL